MTAGACAAGTVASLAVRMPKELMLCAADASSRKWCYMEAWQHGPVIWLKLGAEGASAVTAAVGATACAIMLLLKLV